MMDWYQIISYFFTNELRLILGLFLVASLTGFSLKKGGLLLSAVVSCVVTVLQTLSNCSCRYYSHRNYVCIGNCLVLSPTEA